MKRDLKTITKTIKRAAEIIKHSIDKEVAQRDFMKLYDAAVAVNGVLAVNEIYSLDKALEEAETSILFKQSNPED